jgi:hypothetical protein
VLPPVHCLLAVLLLLLVPVFHLMAPLLLQLMLQ